MKKYFKKAAFPCWLVCMISLVGIHLYKAGVFGNYYIEQEIYKGEQWTWVWHNFQIVWSHHTPLKDFGKETFPDDTKEAGKRIQQIKNAEAFIK